MSKPLFIIAASGVCLVVLLASAAGGGEDAARQGGEPGAGVSRALSKDELLDQLAAQEAQLKLDQARAEMDRAKVDYDATERLFKDKVVTIDDLNRSRQKYERAVLSFNRARIELEKTRLGFLKDATLITVLDARKYRDRQGRVMVAITLRNDSDLGKARVVMGKKAKREEIASLLKIDNVLVSLRRGAIVGDPFQRIIPELRYGQTATLEFVLLRRSVEDLSIRIEYLDSVKDYHVTLKKETRQELPTMSSTQYSLQGELGAKVTYSLEFERMARTEQSFPLAVFNLPSVFSCAFIDSRSKSKITQLKFTRDISVQKLNLEISVPQKLDPAMIDASLEFTVLVTNRQNLATIRQLGKKYRDRKVPDRILDRIKGGRVKLVLVPKGTGKLEILVANKFKEVEQGGKIEFRYKLLNSGTLPLREVTPQADPPMDWEVKFAPDCFAVIAPGEEKILKVKALPPTDIAVGKYTLTLKCEGQAGVETVEARERDVDIQISAKGDITGTLVLVGIMLGLVVFLAVVSVKVSRR